MSALSAAKMCGLAVVGGTAIYALKYSGGKKNSSSFTAIPKDPVKATEAEAIGLEIDDFAPTER